MSASLVGSEMCIRDRSNAPQCTSRGRRKASGARRRASTRRGDGTTADAVSYTHLTLPTICSV
eukprot:4218751-Alexandrium_andersonii.AAC.1